MSAQVTRIEAEILDGNAAYRITVERWPEGTVIAPRMQDLPEDLHRALLLWLHGNGDQP